MNKDLIDYYNIGNLMISRHGAGYHYWMGIPNPNGVTCSGASCEGSISWRDGSDYQHISSIGINMNPSTTCSVLLFNVDYPHLSQITPVSCLEYRSVICQVSCLSPP